MAIADISVYLQRLLVELNRLLVVSQKIVSIAQTK